MRTTCCSLALVLSVVCSSRAADFYVSPNASATGTGSLADPVTLANAIFQSRSPAKPGDTLWLRGGTYPGPFQAYLYGQAGKPITIRQYPGERAIIDGNGSTAVTLYIYGGGTVWRDIEVVNSSTTRTAGVGRPAGVYVEGFSTKLINCVVHDVGLGIGFWTAATDSEMSGCLIYNVGFEKANNVGNGHSVYSANDVGTKTIHDNILCNSFGFGFNIYTEGGQIRGFDLQGNISFNAGASSISDHRYSNLFVGGYKPAARLNVVSNFTYTAIGKDGAGARFSYGQPDNEDMVCTDNVFIGSDIAFQARYWHTVNVQRNVIYTSPSQTLMWAGPFNTLNAGSIWNNNQYYGVGTKSFQAGESTTSFYDFAGWKNYSGRDQNSTSSSGAPTGVRTVVRPNKYEPKRGHVAIYNWDQLDRVAVDVSGVLQPGDRFQVRNAQNYFGTPVLNGTYAGGTLLLPTTNLHAAAPAGMAQSNVKPDKTFNSYVIIGTAGTGLPANTSPTLSVIANQSMAEDAVLGAVAFTVGDAETSAGNLILSASSSNAGLIPANNIVLGGSGGSRTISLAPAANQNGSANITVTVSDGLASTSRTFTVSVSAVNDAPSISTIVNQTTSLGVSLATIPFTVGDPETSPASLIVLASSSNPTLLAATGVVLGGSGANRTVTLLPVAGRIGSATVVLTVSDGTLTTQTSFTLNVQSIPTPPVGLVAHWKFDETSGVAATDAAGANPGTLLNGPARVAGIANGALNFDGVNDYVNIPDSAVLDFSGTFSISLWFNPSQGITALSGRKDVLKKFLSYWLIFNYPSNDGKLSFVLNSGSPVLKSTTSAWTAGQWYHVVATGDGSTLRLFVNGVLESSMSSTVTPVANGYPLQIGGNTEQGYYFPGAIDDVRLYSAALPADAVQALSSIIAAQVAPRPTMAGVTLAGTDVRVSFTTVAGRSYRVEWSDNPVSGVWSAVTTNVSGNGGVVQVTHGNGAGARSRFYRAAVLP